MLKSSMKSHFLLSKKLEETVIYWMVQQARHGVKLKCIREGLTCYVYRHSNSRTYKIPGDV